MNFRSKSAAERITKDGGSPLKSTAPDGYPFLVEGGEDGGADPVQGVTIGVSDLKKSLDFWNGILGMKVRSKLV